MDLFTSGCLFEAGFFSEHENGKYLIPISLYRQSPKSQAEEKEVF